MKKILCLIALACAPAFAFAQTCTPDLSITQPGIYPDATTDFPQAYAGTAYSTVAQFKVMTDTVYSGTYVSVTDVTLDSISGLPPGFTFSCNPANRVFPGGSNACITLEGNPALSDTGTYKIEVHITLHGVIFGFINVSQAEKITGYRIEINGSPEARFNADATTICAGNAVNFEDFSTDNPTVYQWSFPGGNPSSSNLQTPPPVIYPAQGNYNVSLTVYNPVGNHTKTKNAYITVDSSPAAAITANGPVTFCKGDDVTLTANTGSGLTYQWTNVYVPIQGATNSTWNAHARSWVRVTVTNAGGCSTISNLIHVYVDTLPSATITVNGPLMFCQGESVTLTANSAPGLTYQWTKHDINIAGATNKSFTPPVWGNYRVVTTNSFGCSKTSNRKVVIINPLPIASITASGPLTFCQGQNVTLTANSGFGLSYQWTKYFTDIPGETGNSYVASKTGSYRVVVTDLNGCSRASLKASVLVNCREESENDFSSTENSAVIYPNPVSSVTTLKLHLMKAGIVSVRVFDVTGKLAVNVAEGYFEEGKHEFTIDASALSNGVYSAQVKTDDGLKSIKMAVNKN